MLESVHNFREVAGYRLSGGGRIKGGMLYRSGALELVSTQESERLLQELRVATVLDLRHPDECEGLDPHALAGRVVRMSLFPEKESVRGLIGGLNGLYGTGASPERYLHYLKVAGPALARSFALLAEEKTYPLLVHCVAGKDRTGILIALLMDLLGASEADIAHEYGMSNAATDRLIAYLRGTGHRIAGTDEELRKRLATPQDVMGRFVVQLREKHGGAQGYLERQGVNVDNLEAVYRLLVAHESC